MEKNPEISIPIDPKPTNNSCNNSPEISHYTPTPSPNKPPKYPSPNSPLLKKKSFKSKTRFGEQSILLDSQTLESLTTFDQNTPRKTIENLSPFDQNTPRVKKNDKHTPDEKEIYQRVTSQLTARNRKKLTVKLLLQLVVFLCILFCLVSSLSVKMLKGKKFLNVEMWKWFVLIMVTFSGMLVTQWLVHMIVFFIEWKFLLKKNVVYFTHGLQTNVVVFVWIGVVLCTWCVLVKPEVRKGSFSKEGSNRVLEFITCTLIVLLVGSFLWVVKTAAMKTLASSFHLNRFFERIQEAVYQHYVLQTLSGKAVVEIGRRVSRKESGVGVVSFTEGTGERKEKKVVDWGKLHEMKQEKVPSWTMKLLVDVVSNSGLTTMSGLLNEDVVEGGVELDDNEITSEEAAICTAVRVFYNVIGDKNEFYIERDDLHRFMIREEVNIVYQFFEANEKGQIDLKAFCQWVVKVYKDRQALKHALNDNKTAVDELNKIMIGILIVMMIILWLLLTEIATTKVLLFFSSQLVVAAFIFGNTCKTVFEAIIFVFVMHPFDVSDRCVIDGTMFIVEEMNILNTVFLKPDNEKVYYPNSVLSTKAISNFYRSPDQGDTFEFSIDYRTPLPKIAELKERIKQYLEQNPFMWHPNHSFVVKEIENINEIKVALYFNHTMNFQDYPEKSRRRTQLVLEMKNIFDSLEIRYNLLPQEVLLSNTPTHL